MTRAPAPAGTIYALSSGAPPAAIAIVRISGPDADAALQHLSGRLPEARSATLVEIRADGELLDRGLALRFPGPGSVTGEDIAELHLHGGRAVVAAVLDALSRMEGLRPAEAGEFTRRAFENGRLDLAEAEGLADLLAAETEAQRRAALAAAGGALSRQVEAWREGVLELSAALEAALDFSDEGEVGEDWPSGWQGRRAALAEEMKQFLRRAPAERLRDGVRVVVAGPPNAGKSSLINHIAGREVAITSSSPGTTRDVIEVPLAVGGLPFVFCDTAGLRQSADEIEREGVARAEARIAAADVVLWLGGPGECAAPGPTIDVGSKCDLGPVAPGSLPVSAATGAGVDALLQRLLVETRGLFPSEGQVSANARQRASLSSVMAALVEAGQVRDMLIAAECLRAARTALDKVTGRSGVEDMLDTLFGRFCIGK
jgi:tRNA modification GTPase